MLYGRCDEDLGIPYQPWAEVLTHLVAHGPDAVLAAHVDARGKELARLAPDLAGRAAGPASSSDAESERYLLFGAVVDLLARVSVLAPVVLVLDDLHWADRPTVQLLRHVVSADASLRLFGDRDVPRLRHRRRSTRSPKRSPRSARESGVERIALGGLGGDELLVLLETRAGHALPDEGVAVRDALLGRDGRESVLRR